MLSFNSLFIYKLYEGIVYDALYNGVHEASIPYISKSSKRHCGESGDCDRTL